MFQVTDSDVIRSHISAMAKKTFYRHKNYEPGQESPFRLSRSKIELFLDCPRCFYLDRRLGVSRPSGAPFTLNNAVDHLLKKEFDVHRMEHTAHPLVKAYGLDLRPLNDKRLNDWRENFVGVQHMHEESNFIVFGAVDDLWSDKDGTVYVVDYKATSKDEPVMQLEETKWHDQYRRQMEVYQWLLRHNGLTVSDTGYFVYVNGKRDAAAFDGKLEFDINLIPYEGGTDWIDDTLVAIKACLDSDSVPKQSASCEYCDYRAKAEAAF